MNSRRFDYTISFNADTEKVKKQLQSLQNQINSLTMQGSKQLFQTPDFSNAINDISKLNVVLKNSIDESGKLNLSNFSKQLNTAGLNAEKLRNSMVDMGPAGQKAFYALTDAVLGAEVPLKRTNTLLNKFSQTLVNTAKWQISSNIMHGLQSGLQQAYGYAQNLNKSLNEIRIVTGYSTDQMADFAKNANNAAKSLRASTLAYTDAALIYYQQGLTGREITERTNATIKLSNVTGDTVETVSNQLTAVWNNFADGSKNLEYYVDVMTALGAATASSTDEIATGLEKFAAVAETTGLSYEYATSALATVTATTRQSAEVVGTAFKTLFARIQDLELGKTLEDGTSLGSYSQALATVGVNIKEQNGELKEMDQILDEMGSKWATLGKAEQVSLAQTVAGTRQYTQLIALMDNWDFFRQNVNTARGSAGTLEAQAQIYAESWEAANKKVKASAEEIYSSLINDKFFIKLTNFFGDVLNVLDNIIDGVGGLKGVLTIVSAILMKTFSKQMTDNFNAFGRNMVLAGQGLKNGKTFGEKIKGGWQGITGETALRQDTINQRQNFAEAASFLAADRDMPAEDLALSDLYAKKYKYQNLILQNADKLTEQDRQQLTLNGQIVDSLIQQYDKQSDMLKIKLQEAEVLGITEKDITYATQGKMGKKVLGMYKQAEANLDKNSAGKVLNTEKNKQILQELTQALKELSTAVEGKKYTGGLYDKLGEEVTTDNFSQQKGAWNQIATMNGTRKLTPKEQEIIDKVSALAVERDTTQSLANRQYQKGQNDLNEKLKKSTLDFGSAMSSVTYTMMSLSMVMNSFEGIIESLKDSSKSASEKIETTISGLGSMGFSIMQIVSQMKFLGVGISGSLKILPVLLALIGSAKLVGVALDYKESTKPEKKIQKAREEYEKNKEVLQENIDAYDDLNKSIESLGDQADSISKLTKGTTDWYLAISKSNNQLVELLKTYKLLNKEYYKIDNDGLYSLTKKGEAALKGAAFKQAQTAQQSMALNEIALSQQTQAANNQAFAKNNDIATALQKTGTAAEGSAAFAGGGLLGYAGGTALAEIGFNALAVPIANAAIAGGASAASIVTGLTAAGSVVPIIGTLIGAVVGLGAAIYVTTSSIEKNNQKLGTFAEQVANTMNETGATLEDANFADKMRSLGYDIDETAEAYLKEIKTSKKARDAIDEFAASVAQAKAQQDMYWQQLAENNLQSDSYYNSLNTDTEKSDYVKITAQALRAATEEAYNETYKDKGGGMTDEEIQKAYAKAIGWTFVKNLGGNKGRYMDNEGKEQEVSDEVARRYLASIDKNTQRQAKEIARNIKNLEQKGKDGDVASKFLYNVASGQGIEGITEADAEELKKRRKEIKNYTEDELEKYGIDRKDLIKNLNIILNYYDKENNYLKKQGFVNDSNKNLVADWGQGTWESFSDQTQLIADVYGDEKAFTWFNAAINLRKKMIEAANGDEDTLTKINNLDFSKINIFSNSFYELIKKLFNGEDGDINNYIKILEETSATTLDELKQKTNDLLNSLEKLKKTNIGETIEEAVYNSLPENLKGKYVKNKEGTYTQIGIISKSEIKDAEKKAIDDYMGSSGTSFILAKKDEQTAQENKKTAQENKWFSRQKINAKDVKAVDTKENASYFTFESEEDRNNFLEWAKENWKDSSTWLSGKDEKEVEISQSYSGEFYSAYADWYNTQVEEANNAYNAAVEAVNTAQNKQKTISLAIPESIGTLKGLSSWEDQMLSIAKSQGVEISENDLIDLEEARIRQIVGENTEKYYNLVTSGLLDNYKENKEKIWAMIKEDNRQSDREDFYTNIKEFSEELNSAEKGSKQWNDTMQKLSGYLKEIDIDLSPELLENYPDLLDDLKDAAGGSAEAIRRLNGRLQALALFGTMEPNGQAGDILKAFIEGSTVTIKGTEFDALAHAFAVALGAYVDTSAGNGTLTYDYKEYADDPNMGGMGDTNKLNTEIDKLNSRRSILQSKMEHAYDEARRDMEKQEINLVDQLIAKQKALLAVTTDAAQKESILVEIESLRSERESLELDAIKNKYQEIEQLLKNQKSLYEDLADIKKAQGATDLEQLQSEIEGLNFALTDIILAGKNFEEARAYYENHQNDKHAIEQYQEAIVNLSSAQAAFWKTRESITNEINSILDKSDEKINNYIDGLDHIAEGFKNLNDILKSSTFFLSLDEKVLTNINKLTKEANKLTLNNNKNILTARIAERKTYQENIKGYKSQLADPTLSAEDRTMYEEYLKTAEEKLQSIEDSIQTTWKDSLDLVNSIFEESVDEAIKNFEDSVSSYSSLENLKKAFDFQKEESDQVLDSVTQTYELSKLSRTIAQEIGNKTSLKAQNSLKNLLEEINQIQKDKTQLSEQELKNLQQRYDLRLAEIALEEAQWNKTQMRLQRNANGTWSYTYGSTNEDLIKAQQNLEDKQQEIYKTSSEMVDNMSEKLISSLQSYSSGMQDITKKVASGEMTAEQAEEAYRLNRNYLKQATNYAKQLEKALSYANINYIDTDLAKATGTKTLADLMSNITDATEKLDTDVSDALNNLIFQTRDLFQTAEFDINNTSQIIAQAQVASIEKTKDMNKATEELSDTMDGLNKKIDDFRNMWANMSGYIAKSFETIDQLIERLEKIGKSLAGFGDFDIESISKNNNNKNNSNWSSNTTGTKSFVKYDPDVDYAALYKKARNAGASQTTLNQILAQRNRKVDEVNAAGGNAKKLTGDEIMALDTGGYTGDWGSDGKLAILHEKELVLNKEDTANILNAVNAVRSLSSGILKDIFANSGFLMDLLSGMSSAPSINPNGQLEQNVRIEASFPNVSSKDEIEAAFTDLVNQAAQFASIKNL